MPTPAPSARASRFVSIGAAYARAGRHAPGFDSLRIAAATLVVWHHSTALTQDILRADPLYRLSEGYTTLGFFAVSVFFCISGFLVTPGLAKNGDVVGYLSRRFMRVMPLLAVVVITTFLVIGPLATRLPMEAYFSDPRSWAYLRNITTSLSLELPGVTMQDGENRVNGALWTMRYEVLCYLVLALLAAFRLLRARWVMLAVWLGASATTVVTFGGQGAPSSQFLTLCHLFAYFGAGVLLWLFRERLPAHPLLFVLAAALLVVAWAGGLGPWLSPLLTAYLVAGLGLLPMPWSERLSRVDPSYGIYLWHGPAMALVLAAWRPDHHAWLFAATMAATLPLALASWFALEKPALARKSWPVDLLRSAPWFRKAAR